VLLIFPERQTDLTLDCVGDTITIIDDALLLQICGNLLTNALKYSHPGTPVSVRCEAFLDELRITVDDQGIGIPPEDREFLFESFRRASNVETISGTGLGLAIVKRATDALRGSVRFTTELGVGTTFEVVLPSVTRETLS
jgi:signal transduction histidine kinase